MKHNVSYNSEAKSVVMEIMGDFSKEDAKQVTESVKELFQVNPGSNMLADFSQSPNLTVDRDTRKILQETGFKLEFQKVALVGVSHVTRMIAKVILVVIGKIKESDFFQTRDEALRWLKE